MTASVTSAATVQGLDALSARRVRVVTVFVPTLALTAGTAATLAGARAYVLVAAAVVFGWSQLSGA